MSALPAYTVDVRRLDEFSALDLYAIYRHTEGDVSTQNGLSTDLDGFDMVITGARIQF